MRARLAHESARELPNEYRPLPISERDSALDQSAGMERGLSGFRPLVSRITIMPERSTLHALFLEDNLARATIGELTRELVNQEQSRQCVIELSDGTPALRRGTRLLGCDLDEQAFYQIVQRAGERPTFVVFGLGMGHSARGLRAHSSAAMVVFEPDPSVVRDFFESGPSDLGDVPIVCTTHDLTQIWQGLFYGNKSVTVVSTPGYVELYPEQARVLRETVAQLVQRSGVNDATHRLRSRVWIEDVLANVDLLREHPSFLALAGQYRGTPAFIVGAGPSLGKNGHLLADAAQKGIVIALNSSARALESYGVEPQVLACMESIDVSPLLSSVSYLDRVVRVMSLTAHPRNLRTGRGPLLPVFEGIPQLNGPLQALLGFRGLPVSGSVSTLAFSLAERLGCSPIVFVGQDLAYTDGQAYARGSPYEESRVKLSADGEHLEHEWCDTLRKTHNQGAHKMQEREPLRQVVAFGGRGTVMSTIGFCAVRDWMEAACTLLGRERPALRLVNATEGGARIAGFEEITLASLLCTLPVQRVTPQSIREAAERAQAPLGSEQVAAWARGQAALSRAVRHAARRVRRLGESSRLSVARGQAGKVITRFARLEVAELALKEAVARLPFVDAWAHADIDAALDASAERELRRDDHDSAVRSVELEVAVSGAIENAARELELRFERLAESMISNASGTEL